MKIDVQECPTDQVGAQGECSCGVTVTLEATDTPKSGPERVKYVTLGGSMWYWVINCPRCGQTFCCFKNEPRPVSTGWFNQLIARIVG